MALESLDKTGGVANADELSREPEREAPWHEGWS